MKKLIKKILNENVNEKLLTLVVKYLKVNGPPYFYNLRQFDINKKSEVKKVLKQIIPNLYLIDETEILNKKGDRLYYESHQDFYEDNETNFDWELLEYDENGHVTYYEETDDGILTWQKYKYDENDNEVYYEDSDGDWKIFGYDNNNKLNYEEDSRHGVLMDER